jgi:hypothetical protein
MSDPLAISGVSAVLQYYLYNMYTPLSSIFGGQVAVTAQAPDLVQSGLDTSNSGENQVNLFMHQVTYNPGWRNVALPSLDADGKTRLKSPPLALDLHYLLTAYGSADWQAEGLLGYALMLMHENPVLTRDDISYALGHLTGSNNMIAALKVSTLADQVEMIKITPATLGKEELAWLWTALKADYRPTFPFLVSVVLIQPQLSTSLALPVLRRSIQANTAQPAVLSAIAPPNKQVAAQFSDPVTVTGEFLSGVSRIWLTNAKFDLAFPVPISQATAASFQFIANTQTQYPGGVPPGMYSLVAQWTDATATAVLRSTNALTVSLAPTLPAQAVTPVSNGDGTFTVTVSFTPAVWEGQDVSLSLSSIVPPVAPATLYSMTAPASAFAGNANTSLNFIFPAGLPAGPLLGRLTVDGVTSQVAVTPGVYPPAFTGPMVTIAL